MISICKELVFDLLPQRSPETNKGNYGTVLCLAGSSRFRGAASLCAEGALRTGAGIVCLASTEPVIAATAARLPECTFLPCAPGSEGGVGAQNLELLLSALPLRGSLVIGCGMGNTADTKALVCDIIRKAACPLVLDADGLNATATCFDSFFQNKNGLIITPHPGEMARLLNCTIADVEKSRAACALDFSKNHGCVVVLKGHKTLVACPDGKLFCNTSGNAGMARGGSGDVLAGMVGALLAQGLSPADAAVCGVWLHGAAGDLCAGRLGQMGMLPHDLLQALGNIFAQNLR